MAETTDTRTAAEKRADEAAEKRTEQAQKDAEKRDEQARKDAEKRAKKVKTEKKDGYVVVDGGAKRVDPENLDSDEQFEAFLHYKTTGEVGAWVDPLRDQEPDIAPERGVFPAPELYNPAPPKAAVGSESRETNLTAPLEEKIENNDPSVAQGLNTRQ